MGERYSHIISVAGKKWDIGRYLGRYLKQGEDDVIAMMVPSLNQGVVCLLGANQTGAQIRADPSGLDETICSLRTPIGRAMRQPAMVQWLY